MKTRHYLKARFSSNAIFLLGWILILGLFTQTALGKTINSQPYQLGGDFTLVGHHGKKVSLADYRGKVVLLTFGYTHCPDICSVILSQLKQIVNKLEDQADQVQILFITVDPERDKGEHFRDYVTYFNPTFLGLNGTQDEITKVTQQYGGLFIKQEIESQAGYFFAHTDYMYLIDQQGLVREIYRSGVPLDARLDHIHQLLALK